MIITGTARMRFRDQDLKLMFDGMVRFEKDTDTGYTTITHLEPADGDSEVGL